MQNRYSQKNYSEESRSSYRGDYSVQPDLHHMSKANVHRQAVPVRPARSASSSVGRNSDLSILTSSYDVPKDQTDSEVLKKNNKQNPDLNSSDKPKIIISGVAKLSDGKQLKQDVILKKGPPKHTSTRSRATKSAVLKRDFVQKPQKKQTRKAVPKPETPIYIRFKRALRPTTFAVSMFGALLLVGLSGVLIAYGVHSSDHPSIIMIDDEQSRVLSQQDPGEQDNVQPDPSFLSEDKPTQEDFSTHNAVNSQPKLLTIPSLELRARILPKTVDLGNELILPKNIYDVGWYEASRKPNQPGVVLLHGHVSGPNERGIFYYLRVLEAGDEIQITDANDKVYTYIVQDKKFLPYDQMKTSDLLIPYDANKDGLNLAAFDTRFNVLSERFQDRLVVYTIAR